MKSNSMTMGEEFIQIGLTVVQKRGGGGVVKARRLQQTLTMNQIPEPDEPVMKRHSCTLDNKSVKD